MTGTGHAAARPVGLVRWPVALAFACVAAAPFLLTLIFVFNCSFLWGFLNLALTAALALLAFAAWVALARRVHLRALLFLVITSVLLIGHGVAGVGLSAGSTIGKAVPRRSEQRPGILVKAVLELWPTAAAALVTIVLWKALGAPDRGRTV